MSNEFKREDRYIVIKRKDLNEIPDHQRHEIVNAIKEANLPPRKCVVVESDWPEYEPTWAAIERRVTGEIAWCGALMPLPGAKCEIRIPAAGTDWAEAIIHFAARNVVVWDWAGEPAINGLCTAYAHAVEMRPVRTPEQIEAEEREKAIAEMADTARNATGFGINLADMAALYDAGYRKQVAP